MTAPRVITAFTDEQVARLTDISVGQLRYWDKTDFFHPEFAYDERRDAHSRIYSYLDLVSLKVIAHLRNRSSLQQLRIVKENLREFTPQLWRGLTLWVHDGNVAFEHPDTGEPEEVISGQKLMKLQLSDTLDELEASVRSLFKRNNTTLGRIEKHRRIMRNRPVIAGTRIPVTAVRSFHEAGYSVQEIVAEYPSLTAKDVRAALTDDHAA